MSIKKILYCIVAIIVLAMAGIMATSNYFTQKIETVLEASQYLAKLDTDMQILRRQEKEFLAVNEQQQQDAFNVTLNQLHSHLQKLQRLLTAANIPFSKKQSLNTMFDQYRRQFNEIVIVQQRIGLNNSTGLSASLQETAAKLATQVTGLDGSLAISLQLLRCNEKDFMLYHQDKYAAAFSKQLDAFRALLALPENSEVSNELSPLLSQYQQLFSQLLSLSRQMGLIDKQGMAGELRKTVEKTEQLLAQESKQLQSQLMQLKEDSKSLFLTLGFFMTLLIAGLVFYLANRISVRLQQVTKAMHEISSGHADLRVSLDTKGHDEISEISRAFNTFVGKIYKTVNTVANSVMQLASTTEEMSVVMQQSKNGVLKQKSDIEQVATVMDEMNAAVREVKEHTIEAENMALQAKEKAHQGKEITEQNIEEITQLSHAVATAAEVIKKLIMHSQNISGVLSVIRGIAEQTNLLALNAAIEAARAGESGRGFAVVADEVRNLALRTQEATKEILTITDGIQTDAQAATEVMENSEIQASNAVSQTQLANSSLCDITETVIHVSALNSQIAVATAQQSHTSTEISKHMVDLSNICEESATGIEQLAVANHELSVMTQDLKVLVEQFELQ